MGTRLDVPKLDFDRFDAFHTRVFDRHLHLLAEIDDGAVLSLTTNSPVLDREGHLTRSEDGKLRLDWRPAGTAPVRDAERAWSLIERAAKRGAACYLGVAPRRAGTTGQGGKGDVVAHTVLVADLDWSEGDHQASSNPPREVLEQWIRDLPALPGIVVDTGGGFHLYLCLDEPIDVQRDPRGQALYAGWRQWWVDRAKQDGYTVDIAPLTNQALVLRLPGTPCPKYQGRLVEIERTLPTTDDDHSIDDLLALFPAPPEPPARKKAASSRGTTGRRGDTSAVLAGGSLRDYSPGDLFAVEGDLEQIVVDLLEAECVTGNDTSALRMPWTDCGRGRPEYPEGKNSGVFVHYDGTPLVYLWGQGIREEWAACFGGEPDVYEAGDAYNAFGALGQFLVRIGEEADAAWSVAARLVVHYRTIDKKGFADYGSLYDDLYDARSIEDVIELLPRRREVGTLQAVDVAPAPAPHSGIRILSERTSAQASAPTIRLR